MTRQTCAVPPSHQPRVFEAGLSGGEPVVRAQLAFDVAAKPDGSELEVLQPDEQRLPVAGRGFGRAGRAYLDEGEGLAEFAAGLQP